MKKVSSKNPVINAMSQYKYAFTDVAFSFNCWNGEDTIRQTNTLITYIPFESTIELLPPLKSGIDNDLKPKSRRGQWPSTLTGFRMDKKYSCKGFRYNILSLYW